MISTARHTSQRATSCARSLPTPKVANPGSGPLAWCSTCKSWRPAAQVPWGAEQRNDLGRIIATYAPLPH
jgi:hypothetical protein